MSHIPQCDCSQCITYRLHADRKERDEIVANAFMESVKEAVTLPKISIQRKQETVPPETDCELSKDALIAHLTEGMKFDGDKPMTELYPVDAYMGTCRGLTYGAKKYAPRNWEKGIKFGRVFGALLRHLFAWWKGEDVDPESGLHHLDHAGCCLAFLQQYTTQRERYAAFDDRPTRPVGATGEIPAR